MKGPKGKFETKVKVEYSGREVGPHGLLLQQILSAHSIFLLHHGPCLAEMYTRLKRTKFCAALDRFWFQFLREWDVLLHGTPVTDIYRGIKLAAGGELGVGVGEENWGSGEREVLEDFTTRTDGLIDVIVSHFDDGKANPKDIKNSWLGMGKSTTSSDGVIYSGTGRITRESVATVSKWMQWIYRHGLSTYGVQDNPQALKRQKKRKQVSEPQTQGLDAWPTEIPPSLILTGAKLSETMSTKVEGQIIKPKSDPEPTATKPGTEILMKYVTFGLYGSGWGLPTKNTDQGNQSLSSKPKNITAKEGSMRSSEPLHDQYEEQIKPYFLIGLQGSLEDDGETGIEEDSNQDDDESEAKSWNNCILLRTLYIEHKGHPREKTDNDGVTEEETDSPKFDRVQVIVYINQPFIFTFIFKLNTPMLSYTSFYKSIHHQLGPLRRPLLRSTSPDMIHKRLFEVASPRTISSMDNKQPIYDLIYDPINFTIHTTIPPIPEANDLQAKWSRLDALSVHLQIINTHQSTRQHHSEIERTAKTSRGWWVVWLRFPAGAHKHSKEAFLVRKSTDYVEESGRKGGFGFGKEAAGWGSSAGRVAEGIGIDARRYVEGLISLSR